MTQAVCEVCAVSYDDVRPRRRRLPSRPQVLSLDPSTLGEVLADVPRLAEAAGAEEGGRAWIADRAPDAVHDAVAGAQARAVAAIEWLDPVFIGGHWVPQMIELAGGIDVLGLPGEKSRTADWDEVAAARARGHRLDALRLRDRAGGGRDPGRARRLAPLGARVVAVDASSYFSRPGPRLVDGIELLGHLLHPDLVPAPPAGRFAWLDLARPARRRYAGVARTVLILHSSAGLYGADVQLLAIVRGLDPERWRAICVLPERGARAAPRGGRRKGRGPAAGGAAQARWRTAGSRA